ncbi:A24 family peptidase [Nocardia sp. NBC_01730]|uniref:A24 family peptidase n=1 Tax=Nocardia sp. NBC_01730 TaxID=2975998 RepID=UPI002E15FE0C|nr:A24 family peptidase [Nocardia sp. NBC_01730]
MSPIVFALLTGWCSALSVIDLRHRRLPDVLTGWGAAGIFGYALCTARFTSALLGAVLLAVPYLVIHLVASAAFGAGDVKLAVGLGAVAACGGAQAWVWAAIAAPVLTACAGLVLLAVRRMRARDTGRCLVPHGPAMCLATLVAVLLTNWPA